MYEGRYGIVYGYFLMFPKTGFPVFGKRSGTFCLFSTSTTVLWVSVPKAPKMANALSLRSRSLVSGPVRAGLYLSSFTLKSIERP